MKLSYGTRGGQPFSGHALALWVRSPRGKRFLAAEADVLRPVMPDLFGRSFLQVGSWGQGDRLIANSEMLHHAVVGSVSGLGEQTLARPDALPIMDKSVDAALLAHTLEFASSPHDVLREADRILTDRGRLMILGFNPWSWWGLRQRIGLRYRAFPRGARFYSVGRVCDWLELLGYDVTLVRRYGVGFPWDEPHSLGEPPSLHSLIGPLMEAYLIVAKKRVVPLTAMRVPLRTAKVRSLVGAVGLPGARSAVDRSGVAPTE